MTGCCRKDFSLLKSSRPCGADLEVSKRYKHFILAEWNTARHIFDLMRVISRTCRLDQMVPDLPLLGPSKKSICYYGIYIPVSHEILVWRGWAIWSLSEAAVLMERVRPGGNRLQSWARQCLSYPFTMNYKTEDIHSSQSTDPSSGWKIQNVFIKGRYFTHSSHKTKNLVIFTHLHVVPSLCLCMYNFKSKVPNGQFCGEEPFLVLRRIFPWTVLKRPNFFLVWRTFLII